MEQSDTTDYVSFMSLVTYSSQKGGEQFGWGATISIPAVWVWEEEKGQEWMSLYWGAGVLLSALNPVRGRALNQANHLNMWIVALVSMF